MKLRPRTRKIGGKSYKDYVVDLGLVGDKRKTRSFKTRIEAQIFLDEQQDKRQEHGDAALLMRHEHVLRYVAAEQRLTAAGGSIEQAVDHWLRSHRPVKKVITLKDAFDLCKLEKELQGLRGKYLSQWACSCRSFVDPRGSQLLVDATRDQVKAWLAGEEWGPKTQRTNLGDLRALFSWAVREKYLAVNPIAGEEGFIQLPKLIEKEPEIFAPEQVQRLFDVAYHMTELGLNRKTRKRGPVYVYRPLLGYLALATFAGVRPFELSRLKTKMLDIDGGILALGSKITKTSDRRVLELQPNCLAWLRRWRELCPDQEALTPPSWDRHLKNLRERAKLRPWPNDVLRHCFASYFLSRHPDKALLQNQMGHSEDQDTLERHYRGIHTPDGRPVTKALAEQFWAIVPPAAGSDAKSVDA